MQANSIVLSVDAANNGSPSNETYQRYDEYPNRSVYIGATHVPESRDMFAFYRTFPSKSGNFRGTSKSAIKLTQDVSVAGVDSNTTLTAPMILEASFSLPVGATSADIKHLRQRLISMLDDDALMDSLNVQLVV